MKNVNVVGKKKYQNDCKMADRHYCDIHIESEYGYWLALIYLHSILEKEAVLAMMDQFLAHPGFIHWPDKAKTSLITSTSSTITATITATCCIVSKSVLPIFPQFS